MVGQNNIVDVVIVCDDDGRVTSIVVITTDKDAAQVVVDAINKLDKGGDCDAGVLCRAASVTIGDKDEDPSPSLGVLPCVLFVAVFASFIVA